MPPSLILHPDCRCQAVTRIDVDVTRKGRANLEFRYLAIGDMNEVALPLAEGGTRADELWRHTCFEAFLRAQSHDGYCEFNFSPSTQWAAYGFDGYRSGVRACEAIPPHIAIRADAQRFEMRVDLSLARFSDFPYRALLSLGIAAVIEEKNGRKSYWALAHPPGKPDFHHADGFALTLPGVLG